MNYYKRTSNNKLLKIWYGMRSRCTNPSNKDYRLYGGRGIKLHPDWGSYENFAKWSLANGYIDGLSIDRLNPNGDYSPSNCEWVTPSENSRRMHANTTSYPSLSDSHKAKISASLKRAHELDPSLRLRQLHFRDTNGNTKITDSDLAVLKEMKLSGKSWEDGYKTLNTKSNVRYFRYVIWNTL